MTIIPSNSWLHLRKKLLAQGAKSLSDTELLAVFIGFGNNNNNGLKLAEKLIRLFGDLREIFNTSQKHFQQIPELGKIRYVQFQAIKEISRRSDFIALKKKQKLTNSKQTYAYLKKRLGNYKNETFAALFLDSHNRIIAYEELFYGTINSTTVHTRPIVERTLQHNAAALILAHNHPSGISDASYQDLAVTERVKNALELIDTRLLDHLIIGDNEVYSISATHKWMCN